jgi:membrane-associated protease RseP (regulator of RpoE activity)
MKSTTRVIAVALPSVAIAVCLMAKSPAHGQQLMAPPAAPTVVHIHHHYYNYNGPTSAYNTISPTASLLSANSPQTNWNYGYQPGTGTYVRPLNQNWGHLGFTGYMGQHGGGVDVTLQQFTGLVVNTVTPGSPASQMGLVPGDFILKINGVPVNSYKQATMLFEQTEQDSGRPLALEVWNPNTRRISTLNANVEEDDAP